MLRPSFLEDTMSMTENDTNLTTIPGWKTHMDTAQRILELEQQLKDARAENARLRTVLDDVDLETAVNSMTPGGYYVMCSRPAIGWRSGRGPKRSRKRPATGMNASPSSSGLRSASTWGTRWLRRKRRPSTTASCRVWTSPPRFPAERQPVWRELSPRANRGGWLWAVGVILALAALNFLEVAAWP